MQTYRPTSVQAARHDPGCSLVVLIPLASGVALFALQRWLRAEAVFAALVCLFVGLAIILLPASPCPSCLALMS